MASDNQWNGNVRQWNAFEQALRSCSAGDAVGGLERRATVITGIRAKESLLLVDAGNWLAGTESIGSHGQIIVAAYDDMAYDVDRLPSEGWA